MRSRVYNKSFVNFLLLFFFVVLVFHLNAGSITLCSVFCILVLLSCKQKILSKNSLLLLLYSLSFAFITLFKVGLNMANIAEILLPPLGFYLFGGMVVDYNVSKQSRLLLFLLLSTLCYGATSYYWSLQDIIQTGSIISPIRILTMRDTEFTATLVGTNVCLGLVGLSAFFVVKDRIIKWGFLLAWLLSTLSIVHMVNRSGLVISIACLFVVFLAYYRGTKHFSTVIISILSVVLLYVFFLNVSSDLQDLQSITEAYGERELDEGSEVLSGGGRTTKWVDALKEIPSHPFGWKTTGSADYIYVHNMWLDIAKDTGWIPFLLLVIITIRITKSIHRLLKKEKSPLIFVFLGLNVCLFLSAFVEPTVGGTFFACYCMIWGMQERYFLVNYT